MVSGAQAAAAFFLLVALLLYALAALALYEAWALLTQHAPITWFVRLGIAEHPRLAFVVVMLIGLLVGHFFWP